MDKIEREIAKKKVLDILVPFSAKYRVKPEDLKEGIKKAKISIEFLKKRKYKKKAEEIIQRLEGNQVGKAKKLIKELYWDIHFNR